MSLNIHFTNSFIEFYFIIIVVTIIETFMTIIFILGYKFRLSESK